MAVRDDIRVLWYLSPRVIVVEAPSDEVSIQDLHETLRDIEDEPANMIHDHIVQTAGLEELGGGVRVGLTSTLRNARLAFEARKAWVSEGVVTAADAEGINLIDAAADFVGDGVRSGGAWVVNLDDGSVASVLANDGTSLLTDGLGGGATNEWTPGDRYRVMNVTQVRISGGNLVAIDADGADIDPVQSTAGTQVVRTSSSSATLQELADIQFSSFEGEVTIDIDSPWSGTEFPVGTRRQPVNNLADALLIAEARGIERIHVDSDLTIPTGTDIRRLTFRGMNSLTEWLTMEPGVLLDGARFVDLRVTGDYSGGAIQFDHCIVDTVLVSEAAIERCTMLGPITVTADAPVPYIYCLNCHDVQPGPDGCVIDMNESQGILNVSGWKGDLIIRNKTGPLPAVIDLDVGAVTLEPTVVAGSVHVRGTGLVYDGSAGVTVVDVSGLVNAEAPWHTGPGRQVRQINLNRLEVNFSSQELVLYDDDGVSIAQRWPLATKDGEDVKSAKGVQTKRGAPIL